MLAPHSKGRTDGPPSIPPAATRSGSRGSGRAVRSIRSVAILSAVGTLVAAIALPAFASARGTAAPAPATAEQLAADNAQSLVVASEASEVSAERSTFTATTPDEIQTRKAEAAAAARAAEAAKAAASAAARPASAQAPTGYALVAPGSGAVRYPLPAGSYTGGEGPGSGRGHEGWDMLAPQGTPIYAAIGGTVVGSAESIGGYGVCIIIMSELNGTAVQTRYGHMVYGSRMVQEGDTVVPGQLIGQVGNTGNSYGSHLHFEVRISGSVMDPEPWLIANAG